MSQNSKTFSLRPPQWAKIIVGGGVFVLFYWLILPILLTLSNQDSQKDKSYPVKYLKRSSYNFGK